MAVAHDQAGAKKTYSRDDLATHSDVFVDVEYCRQRAIGCGAKGDKRMRRQPGHALSPLSLEADYRSEYNGRNQANRDGQRVMEPRDEVIDQVRHPPIFTRATSLNSRFSECVQHRNTYETDEVDPKIS